jgi:hypothetical protein
MNGRFAAVHGSAFGPKRTCQSRWRMSAFGGKADITIYRVMVPTDEDVMRDIVGCLALTLSRHWAPHPIRTQIDRFKKLFRCTKFSIWLGLCPENEQFVVMGGSKCP